MNEVKVSVMFQIKSTGIAYPELLLILINPEYSFFKYLLFVQIFCCPRL